MRRELIRIGTEFPVNESELYKTAGFDVLFHRNYEFVYTDDYGSWQPVNGTWTGAFELLANGYKMN
jgi:hypothetical protein